MNAEYYPGWLTHWQEPMQRVSIQPVLQTFEKMMMDGASVNFYMFFGGNNIIMLFIKLIYKNIFFNARN